MRSACLSSCFDEVNKNEPRVGCARLPAQSQNPKGVNQGLAPQKGRLKGGGFGASFSLPHCRGVSSGFCSDCTKQWV